MRTIGSGLDSLGLKARSCPHPIARLFHPMESLELLETMGLGSREQILSRLINWAEEARLLKRTAPTCIWDHFTGN